jgi:hypothetical protein
MRQEFENIRSTVKCNEIDNLTLPLKPVLPQHRNVFDNNNLPVFLEYFPCGNPETSSWIRVRVRVRLRVTYTLAFPNVLVISEQLRFMFTSSQLETRVITFINMENET